MKRWEVKMVGCFLAFVAANILLLLIFNPSVFAEANAMIARGQ